jgi:hypothetical protein
MRVRALLIAILLAAIARPRGRAYFAPAAGPSFPPPLAGFQASFGGRAGAQSAKAGSSGVAQDQNDAPYQATTLIRRWRVIINTIFEERRASAEEPVLDAVEIAISPGAVKAVREKASREQLEAADANAKKLALAIVSAGERRPDGSVTLSQASVDDALRSVCPIYPFC